MKLEKSIQDMPRVLKSNDISKFLKVSPDDISLLARKGYLKGYKSGRQWRFKKSDIEEWFKHHSKKDILSLLKVK
jgi:excisionase family DNA binding protein